MDSEFAEHVADLHRKAFIIDAHFDLTHEVANRRERGAKRVVETDYLPGFLAGGVDLIVSAIFVHDWFLPEMGLRKALDQVACLHREMDETPGRFRLCRSMAEARAARVDGDIALFLSLEGADPLQNDLNLLRIFYELGVRGLGLVWSRRNYAGEGSLFHASRAKRKGGLTDFGMDLVEMAENLGMVVDVSHLNDEGFEDVMAVARKPVIASHSNCRALVPVPRNLTDGQIAALAEKGGVIGMNALDVFTHQDRHGAAVDHLVDHVDHIVKIAGVDYVGIGFDLCDSLKNHLGVPNPLAHRDVIQGHGDLGSFTAALIRRGYSDEDILKILGGNFSRVFEAILD
ncbi:MAG: dipeptidase [Desulfococcaceae bacterium]